MPFCGVEPWAALPMDLDVEPHDAIVAAADGVAFPALAHHGVIGTQLAVVHHPAGAEHAVGFLVGGERDLDVAKRASRRWRAAP